MATDVVARGIHVEGLPCVVHFDPPADHVDYVHRSGRTGRAGQTGTVVSLVTPEQRKDTHQVQRALGMEPVLLAPFTPATSAHRWPTTTPMSAGCGAPSSSSAAARGFGFVAREDGEDLFVHHSHVTDDGRGTIAPGSTVEFTVGTGRRGDEAQNVRVLVPAPC